MFQCVHRYAVESWTVEQNEKVFSGCFTPHGHGHNYTLEVYIEGTPDATSGMILNLMDVDKMLTQVLAPFDGKHLNFETKQFQNLVPTTENIARELFQQFDQLLIASLDAKNSSAKLIKARIFENEDLWVDIWK